MTHHTGTDDEDEADGTIRPFAAWLRDQRRGGLHDDLSDELNTLVAAVAEHGGKGTLTLKLTVKHEGRDQVTVEDDIKVNAPIGDRVSFFYIDDDHNLSREDPRQITIEGLRSVPDPAEVRDLR